jgi:glycosyltransferase involved in cell wall biosynthesis
MAVSVVVPTRDKASRLGLTLACLQAQSTCTPWEVVVVDDGSEDETPAVLVAAAETLPLRRVGTGGRGRATARNAGASAARGSLLVFLDDDILVGPGFIDAHLRAQEGHCGAVHGRLMELIAVASEDSPQHGRLADALDIAELRVHGFDPRGARLVANVLERAVLAMERGQPPHVPWLACAGANLSVPRDLWAATGGFDEGFGTVWGCEDLEFGLRLVDHGAAVASSAAAWGAHLTHYRPGAWEEHEHSLARFRALHPRPEVRALGALLGPDGDLAAYTSAVEDQYRSA